MTKTALALGAPFLFVLFFGCGGSSVAEQPADDDLGWGNEPPERPRSRGGQGGSGVVVPVGGTGATGGALPTGGTGGTGGALVVGGSGGTFGGPVGPPVPGLCGGVACDAPRACCIATSECFNPESGPEACPRPDPDPARDLVPCASNAHCAPDEYCNRTSGILCESSGFCSPLADCPYGGEPVCACNGLSYASIGDACRAGTNAGIFRGGRCGETVDANEGEFGPRWVTLCGFDGHCPRGEYCCSITSICYPVSDPGRCQMPPEGTRYPCTADDQCFPDSEFCAGEGCSGPGGCASRDAARDDCGIRLEPVCGCDGVSYTSAACAAAEGVRIDYAGECDAGG